MTSEGGPASTEPPGLVLRPGWPAALVALTTAAVAGGLVDHWSAGPDWLVGRGIVAGVALLVAGLSIGSTGTVGLAALPLLGGAVIGLDRPVGHAWGQALLIGILWYVVTEAGWASIEARDGTVRTPAVARLRVREVATTVAAAIVVGLAGTGLASLAPTRTATIKAISVGTVLIGLAALGRHLARENDQVRDEPSC